MSYVDAGYAAALGVLFAYSAYLLGRRRRLERALRRAELPIRERDGAGGSPPPGGRS
jgi:hypothetical protein